MNICEKRHTDSEKRKGCCEFLKEHDFLADENS
jgi:hypothetical protein